MVKPKKRYLGLIQDKEHSKEFTDYTMAYSPKQAEAFLWKRYPWPPYYIKYIRDTETGEVFFERNEFGKEVLD